MSTVAVLVALLAIVRGGDGRRLLLGEDGFARVDGGGESELPATAITVSSWVNITEFPGGVAPLVTIISADATYQIAFFVRHDGAGVLWGGPATAPLAQDDFVDRHPRSKFHTNRKRRNAVDYSMGLGDVMNIMGPRKERSNTWTPMNFVDVSEMGVADLETSGSSTNNHYENWYDVGYELQMQESANPDPKIITQPSGENDFVVINWNGNNVPPLSSNQWDPVNDDLATPEFTVPKVPTKVRAPGKEKFIWSQEDNRADDGWSSQVFPISKDSKISATSDSTTSNPKPRKSTSRSRPDRPFIPDLRRLNSNGEKARRTFHDSFRYNQRRRQPIRTTSTTTTTTRPIHLSIESTRNKQKERVPLWARLKKTSSEEKVQKEKTVSPEYRVRPVTIKPSIHSEVTKERIPALYAQTTVVPRITTRLPVTSTRRPEVIRRKTIQGTTTTKPRVTKPKPHQRFRPTTQSKERKTYSSTTSKAILPKRPFTPALGNNKPLHSHSFDEFKRVLEGKPDIKDNGNKVVVYSMPITDVDAFNRMYEHYQKMESKHSPRINLHAVYEQAREGEIPTFNEDESNQNRLEQIPDPLPVLTYKEEPLHYAKPESAPIIETPIIIETVVEEDQSPSAYDQSSFRPFNIEDPYVTLKKDYSEYYPYVQKAEPIIIISPSSEQLILPDLHNIPLVYEPAVLAQQDISGQQAGFYQEPSRISHEQLPPEYTRKPQTQSKVSISKHSNEINNYRNYRPVHNVRPIQQNSQKSNTPETYSPPELISQQMLAQALNAAKVKAEQIEQISETVERNADDINNQGAIPIRIEAIPVELDNAPEIIKEVPLDVNFRKMPYSFDLNTWYHITFTWNSNDHVLRVYVNGQLAGVLEDTIPDKTILPTSGMMLLGKTLLPSLTGFDPTSHLTGEMSNFVVWGAELSATEVNNVFTCSTPPTHPVLLAWNTTPLRVYNDAAVQQAPPLCGISS